MQAVVISAPWCKPCSMFKPVLTKLCEKYKLPLETVDVEEDPRRAGFFNTSALPTVVFLDGENEVDRWVGAYSPTMAEGALVRLLNP